jgi:hypothetical protein
VTTNIGQQIADLERRVRRMERASRLGSASLDGTALQVLDPSTGGLRGIVGVQPDGTTAVTVVNGAAPPAPSTPTVAPALGGIAVTWDGALAGGAVLPLDWSRVEVHTSATDGFTPDATTLQATIETPQGATVYVPATAPQYVVLLARNTSGTASDPSGQAGPYEPRQVVGADVADGSITETQIADDAVTTPKIKAGAVEADQLAANSVTTPALAAGSVDAVALKADAITGKTITGGTVTGATIQTGGSGARVVLTPTDSAGLPALMLYSGASTETSPAEVATKVASDPTHPRPRVSVSAPTVAADTTTSAYLSLYSGGGADNDQGEFQLSTSRGSGGETLVSGFASDGGSNPGEFSVTVYEPGPDKDATFDITGNFLSWTALSGAYVYHDSHSGADEFGVSGTIAVGQSVVKRNGSSNETWHAPTYSTGWDAGSTSGTFQLLQYRIDAENNVHIVGVCHATAAGPSSTVFTLPSTYCPVQKQRLVMDTYVAQGSASAANAAMIVNTSGIIQIFCSSAIAASQNFAVNAKFPLGLIA